MTHSRSSIRQGLLSPRWLASCLVLAAGSTAQAQHVSTAAGTRFSFDSKATVTITNGNCGACAGVVTSCAATAVGLYLPLSGCEAQSCPEVCTSVDSQAGSTSVAASAGCAAACQQDSIAAGATNSITCTGGIAEITGSGLCATSSEGDIRYCDGTLCTGIMMGLPTAGASTVFTFDTTSECQPLIGVSLYVDVELESFSDCDNSGGTNRKSPNSQNGFTIVFAGPSGTITRSLVVNAALNGDGSIGASYDASSGVSVNSGSFEGGGACLSGTGTVTQTLSSAGTWTVTITQWSYSEAPDGDMNQDGVLCQDDYNMAVAALGGKVNGSSTEQALYALCPLADLNHDGEITQAEIDQIHDQTFAADFNHDGFLDAYDYSDFVTCFEGGSCPSGTTADFNHDGFVDIFDFSDFENAFESQC